MFSLSIHIENKSVYFVFSEIQKKKIKVIFLENYLIQSPLNDTEASHQDLREILSSVYEKVKAKEPFVSLCIPENLTITRKKQFPFKEKSKIKKNIQFQMSDDVIFAEPVFTFKVTEYTSTPITYALVKAGKKQDVGQYVKIMDQCGIKPDVITSEGFALNNILDDLQNKAPTVSLEETAQSLTEHSCELILSIGDLSTTCVLRKSNGVLEDLSHISWGSENLVGLFSEKFKISREQAKDYMNEINLEEKSHVEQKLYKMTIENSFQELVRDLNFKVKKWKSEKLHIHSVSITGPGASFSPVQNWLEQYFQVEVDLLNWSRKSISLPSLLSEEEQNHFSVSLGLSLEPAKSFKNPPANFLDDMNEFKSSVNVLSLLQSMLKPAFVTISLFAVLVSYGMLREKLINESSSDAYKQLKKAAQFTKITGVRGYKGKVKKYIKENKVDNKPKKATSNNLNHFLSALDILESLSSKTSSFTGLNIELLNLNEDSLELKGSLNPSQMQSFQDSLKQLKVVKDVSDIGSSGDRFNLKLTVNRFK